MPSTELAHIIAVCTYGAWQQKVHIRLCPIKALPVQFCVALHRKLRISYVLLRNLFAALQTILNNWQPLLRNGTTKKYQVTPSMD